MATGAEGGSQKVTAGGRLGPFALVAGLAGTLVLGGCGSMGGEVDGMTGGDFVGDPIAMPARPADAACEDVLREAPDAMVWGREQLGRSIPATLDAAAEAARDPAADLFTYGIPLLPDEVAALEAAGVEPDPLVGLNTQMPPRGPVMVSGPDPRTGEPTVSLSGDDPEVLARLLCFEPASKQGIVHYMTDRPSLPRMRAALGKIHAEIDQLRADGIPVTEVWLDEASRYVVIELRPLKEGTGQRLLDRYGGLVELRNDDGVPRNGPGG
jgi:hypothetical protein